jgi:TM2 domain-containing membrane protein YozV
MLMVGSEEKNPTLAAIASFFIPGLGQIYNGEGLPVGVLWLAGMIIGSLFMFIPGIFIWLYGIYNAYKVAEQMNAGLLPSKATTSLNMIIFIAIGIIAYALFAIIITMYMAVIIASLLFAANGTS